MELRHSLIVLILLAAALSFNVHADEDVVPDAAIDISPDEVAAPKEEIQLPPPPVSEVPAPLEEGKNIPIEATQKHIEEIEAERAKLAKQNQELAAQRAAAEQEFSQIEAQEKAAVEQLDKEKQAYKENKEKQDAYLANLKERFKAAQARLAKVKADRVEAERAQSKQAALEKAARAEVVQAEVKASSPRAVSSVAEPALAFKHSCRVFASTQKGADVLEQKKTGDAVVKQSEGTTWVSFKTASGANGFVSKNCFN